MKLKIMVFTLLLLSACSYSGPNDLSTISTGLSTASTDTSSITNSSIFAGNSLFPFTQATAAGKRSTEHHDESVVVYLSPGWSVFYKNEQELMEAADLVIKGTVVEEVGSTFTKGKYVEYTTEVNVQIADVLKGDLASNEIITVSQMGGFDGEVTVISESTTLLKEQQEVKLFLHKSSDGKYRPINEDDGVYILEQRGKVNGI
ncbi:hypothetical protein [Paenibacillus montaniterrae]|nr:hypothetical protein [Paenibacillus montaniterrae]